jgi:hypothetical protein
MAAQRPDALDAASRPSAVGGGIARRPHALARVFGRAGRICMSCRLRPRRATCQYSFPFSVTASLHSETLIAYEIGYRARLAEQFSVDATVFYNDYDQVIGSVPGTPFPEPNIPALFGLATGVAEFGSGYNTGFELAADWRPMQDWRLRLAYSYLYSDIENRHGADL